MRNMRTSNKSMLRQKQSFRVVKLYQNLTSQLKIWQKSRISKWAEDAKISSRQKLKQNLLRKDKNGRVKVNFDFDLLCLLREVKYFRIHGIEIPEAASDIAKNASKYARQIRNLELVSTMYNTMQSTLHPLEVGLLQERLKSLDDILRTAFVSLTWTSSGIDEFVDRALEATRQVHRVSIMLEVNRGKAADLMKRWIEPHNVLVPVCRGSRPLTQNEHEEQYRKAREKQYEFVQSTGETLCEILAESNRAVKISTGLPEWKAYVFSLSLSLTHTHITILFSTHTDTRTISTLLSLKVFIKQL
jgi:dynein heavy chain, axonemal